MPYYQIEDVPGTIKKLEENGFKPKEDPLGIVRIRPRDIPQDHPTIHPGKPGPGTHAPLEIGMIYTDSSYDSKGGGAILLINSDKEIIRGYHAVIKDILGF